MLFYCKDFYMYDAIGLTRTTKLDKTLISYLSIVGLMIAFITIVLFVVLRMQYNHKNTFKSSQHVFISTYSIMFCTMGVLGIFTAMHMRVRNRLQQMKDIVFEKLSKMQTYQDEVDNKEIYKNSDKLITPYELMRNVIDLYLKEVQNGYQEDILSFYTDIWNQGNFYLDNNYQVFNKSNNIRFAKIPSQFTNMNEQDIDDEIKIINNSISTLKNIHIMDDSLVFNTDMVNLYSRALNSSDSIQHLLQRFNVSDISYVIDSLNQSIELMQDWHNGMPDKLASINDIVSKITDKKLIKQNFTDLMDILSALGISNIANINDVTIDKINNLLSQQDLDIQLSKLYSMIKIGENYYENNNDLKDKITNFLT